MYRCADGYIQVSTQVAWFSRVCRVIGRPEWIIDERMTSNLNNPDVIGAEVEAAFLDVAEAADQAAGDGGGPGAGLAAVRAEHARLT